MSAEAAFTRTWRVGRYRATLSCPRPQPGEALCAAIEWEPAIPSRLAPQEIEAYREGRNTALRELASELRIDVAVVDL